MLSSTLTYIADAYVRRTFTSAGLQSHTIAVDTSTTLTYWLSTPTTPPKPLLLLIHGFGPDAIWQWHLQTHSLSRHFSLIIPDLLFFGGSTTTSPHRSEVFQAECVRTLLHKLSIDSVSVVGTSYGGFVAYHLARLMGEAVRKVVIASSDLLKGEEDDLALKERAGVESVADLLLPRNVGDMRTLMRLAMYRQPRFLPDFLVSELMPKPSKGNLNERMELIKAITLGNKDQFQLSPLPQEVLIVWGEHDNIFPLDKAHAMKRKLGDKASLEILKNTSHLPQSEDPRRFNEIVLNFLLDLPKSSM